MCSYVNAEQKLYAYWYLWTKCRTVAIERYPETVCILVLTDRVQKCSYLTLNRKRMHTGTYGQSAEV